MRILVVAVAAVVFSATPPMAASAQQSEPTVAQVETAIAETLRQAQPAIELTQELMTFLTTVNVAAESAMAEKPSAEAARAWNRTWPARLRSEGDELRRRAAALKPIDAAPALRLGMPQSKIAGLQATIDSTRSTVNQTLELTEAVIELAPRVAEGDQKALAQLVMRLMTGGGAMIRAENAQLELAIEQLEPSHPNAPLMRAFIATNQALLGPLDGMRLMLNGKEPDWRVVSAGVERQAAQIRIESAAVRSDAATVRRQLAVDIASLGDGSKDFAAALDRAFASYDDSAAVEEQMAQVIEDLARALRGKDPYAAYDQATSDLEPLLDRRLALHKQRVDILAR